MTIYSSRTRINTPGAPKEPVVCISYLIASISFQPQKSLSEEGRHPQLLLLRRHFGNNQVAGVSLCQIKTLPPLRWGRSGLVHEGPALGAHQSLTSFSIFCLFYSCNRPGSARYSTSLRPPVLFSGPQLRHPK